MLTAEERQGLLQRLVRRRGAGRPALRRARIVFAADAEPQAANKAIATPDRAPPMAMPPAFRGRIAESDGAVC